ncbi:MAG: hypothetical protein ACKVW3_00060 [Phycisphaerales bacterium]
MTIQRWSRVIVPLCLAGCHQAPPTQPRSLLASSTSVPHESLAPSLAEFRPSLHGFRFVNSFTGSPLPFGLGKAEKSLNVPNRFGLCGGMSFAAADFFLAARPRPDARQPPTQGDPLYNFLYGRQVVSLGTMGVMAAKFME